MARLKYSIGTIKLEVTTNISLWQAIKLRIAGGNYEKVQIQLCKEIKRYFNALRGNNEREQTKRDKKSS